MKLLLLIILILLLIPSFVYAEVVREYQYPKITLELKANTIILKQKDNIYTYPSLKKDEYAGIKKVLREDLNGDGKKEYILAVQLEGIKSLNEDGSFEVLPKFPYAVVLIAEQRENENELDIQKQMVLGCGFPGFELADINKDGIKDVVASGWEPMNWSHLKIISWQDDKYVFLWDKGERDLITEQSFGINENGNAQNKVGSPRYIESEGMFDGYKPQGWEIWTWDGDKFVCTQSETKENPLKGE